MLTDAEFRHALLDPGVAKRRPFTEGRGVYVPVASLAQALRERGCELADDELDEHVRKLGGQRIRRRSWLARLTRSERLERPAEYFLPELSYQRVRQTR